MHTISGRAKSLPLSPIRKLMPLADAAKQKGIQVLHLNIGQPDIKTPSEFWDGVRDFRVDTLGYAHSAGEAKLRAAIAEDYKHYGVDDLTAENVQVTFGGSEALQIALQVCLNPGEKVLMPEPFYANYRTLAQAVGVGIATIKTELKHNFKLPSLAEAEGAISSEVKAMIISNPDNPTGKVYTEEELKEILAIADKFGLWLIVDEVYKDFVYEPAKFTSIFSLASESQLEKIIVVDSISKKFSACGARVGALISKNKEVLGMALKYAQARLSVGTLDQAGALALYEADLREYLANVNTEYQLRQKNLLQGLKSIPGVVVPEVSGAFYLIAELPVDGEDFARWLLEEFSYKNSTVMLAPAGGFYSDPHTGKNQVRMAYVLEVEKLELAVECLREALQKYPR